MRELFPNLRFVYWAFSLGRQAGRSEQARLPQLPTHGPWTQEHEEKAGEVRRSTSRTTSVVGIEGIENGIPLAFVRIARLAFDGGLPVGRRSFARDRRRGVRKLRRDIERGREIKLEGYGSRRGRE